MPKKEVRKSAVKSLRQSERARVRHKSRRNALATMEKGLREAAGKGDKSAAAEILKAEYAALDKAVKAGTLHKNKASRKKSRLGKLVAAIGKKVEAAPAAAPQA